MTPQQCRDDGFTLIELLVVVVIIGVLATIAIPSFLGVRQRGWDASAKSDVRNMVAIASTDQTDGQTPTTVAALTALGLSRSPGVAHGICVESPTADVFSVAARHTSSDVTYVISARGRLTETSEASVTAALFALSSCDDLGWIDAVPSGD